MAMPRRSERFIRGQRYLFCTGHGAWTPDHKFGLRPSRPNGRQTHCRKCQAKAKSERNRQKPRVNPGDAPDWQVMEKRRRAEIRGMPKVGNPYWVRKVA